MLQSRPWIKHYLKHFLNARLKLASTLIARFHIFKVGAAFITSTGNTYAGTNAEEAAFNHSIHAEQGAVAQMVAQEGRQKITHLVVVGGEDNDGTVCTPCGHCRQLLVEFAADDMEIAAAGPTGDIRLTTTLGQLLPNAFRMSNFIPS